MNMNDNIENMEVNNMPQIPQNSITPKPKKSKGPIIIILLLLIIIGGLTTFIIINKDKLFNNNENKVETKEDNKKEVNEEKKDDTEIIVKETEVTDFNIKNIITKKVDLLFKTNWGFSFSIEYFDDLLKNTNLTEEDKLVFSTHDVTYKQMPSDKANLDANKKKEIKEFMGETTEAVDAKEIEKNYYELFGTKPNHMDFGQCPNYYYDSTSNVYYLVSACGGISGTFELLYINRVMSKEDKYYAYVNFGVAGDNIYSSYDQKDIVKTLSDNEDASAYKIDATNADKFSEYKVTFTKSGNDYYYESIERTK